jgi:hypothetical protein
MTGRLDFGSGLEAGRDFLADTDLEGDFFAVIATLKFWPPWRVKKKKAGGA